MGSTIASQDGADPPRKPVVSHFALRFFRPCQPLEGPPLHSGRVWGITHRPVANRKVRPALASNEDHPSAVAPGAPSMRRKVRGSISHSGTLLLCIHQRSTDTRH
ncbi:hypothetical protein BO94DRAFT_58303 [Aspergillus sclerotioniger CBS 115572]|uniref:Uncharacterized protein n=1 Tax=Aspergillus sclerotioniger CBS 115572 TaxID=1450535 RepID=A0A317WRI6_9EURO|nr:hypothetical protein BO94DRAFT_58303 [Aspergillus sclerotioniger CBS 115572]PWY87912.1 hypothetical protein BO94DRAFT_58303 [Aspergillus sclerotioniger CBS 115572]